MKEKKPVVMKKDKRSGKITYVAYEKPYVDGPVNLRYMPETVRSLARACLLGGAIGDAMGAPIEFLTLAEMRQRYGAMGVTDFVADRWPAGSITDDTQMTLFTAEGMIRAKMRAIHKGIVHGPSVVCNAYLRWLMTQDVEPSFDLHDGKFGLLLSIPELHARRAPGNTCLSALQSMTTIMGDTANNSSKGCGGVMRMAPVGLLDAKNSPGRWEAGAGQWAFKMGRDFAALTHGHPTGYLAAATFAVIIGALASGAPLGEAISIAKALLIREEHHHETLVAINRAVEAAAAGPASAETVETLGGGWVAEEALSIGLYCATIARTFEEGVLLAVNHSGDSDSTGSIAGNLLGLIHGEGALPRTWLDRLELKALIARVAEDMIDCQDFRSVSADSQDSYDKLCWDLYPGY